MKHSINILILTGTKTSNRAGGIGKALESIMKGLKKADIHYEFIPTYSSDAFSGKFFPWLKAIPIICCKLLARRGKSYTVWLHPGSYVSMLREGVIGVICRMLGVKVYWQAHSVTTKNLFDSLLGRICFRLITFGATNFVVLTPWWSNEFEKITSKPIHIIPNGINNKLPARSARLDNETIQILAASRLVRGKGFEQVILAMENLEEKYHLCIAGEGKNKKALMNLVNERQLQDRVTFTGWLDQANLEELFLKSSIFCLPSTYDSFGMVFIESMQRGIPIVASNWGPVSDVVVHEEVGLLVNPNDINEISNAIKWICTNSNLYTKMSKRGPEYVQEKFSIEALSCRLISVFKEV